MEDWLAERYLLEISGYIQSLALRRDERQVEDPANDHSSAETGRPLAPSTWRSLGTQGNRIRDCGGSAL